MSCRLLTGFLRLPRPHGESLVGVCVLAAVLAGCASPEATGPRDAISSGSSAAEPSAAAGPRFGQGGPDAEDYGASVAIRSANARRVIAVRGALAFFVGCHSHFDQVYEGRLVRRATTPSPLARAASEPAIRYEYEGQTFSLDDYLARNPTTGVLVARGDTILIERYQYARHDRHRFTSWSMAKTVTAMLIGIAIAEGRIRSVDDPAAAYVPALAGTEYGRTSLRHLLQMSSGVRFIEEYTAQGDVARLVDETFRQVGSGGVEAVTPFNVRAVPADEVLLCLGRDPGARPRATKRGRSPSRRLLAGEDLAADGGRSRRDLAHRPRGPGGSVVLP